MTYIEVDLIEYKSTSMSNIQQQAQYLHTINISNMTRREIIAALGLNVENPDSDRQAKNAIIDNIIIPNTLRQNGSIDFEIGRFRVFELTVNDITTRALRNVYDRDQVIDNLNTQVGILNINVKKLNDDVGTLSSQIYNLKNNTNLKSSTDKNSNK